MHLTITGELGSGKSTICQLLEDRLGYTIYSTGKIQRKLAEEYNMTTLEFNKFMENNPKFDKQIDDKTVEISKNNPDESIAFDSRMAWHFVDESFKIYLTVDSHVSAERVYSIDRGDVEKYKSIEDARRQLIERRQNEITRFKNKYGVQINNFNNFDLVIDTTYAAPDEVFEVIKTTLEAHKNNEVYNKFWVSPIQLFPTKSIELLDLQLMEQILDDLKNNQPLAAIEVIEYEDKLYVVEGHHRLSAAIHHKEALVPVVIKKVTDDVVSIHDFLNQSNDTELHRQWREAH